MDGSFPCPSSSSKKVLMPLSFSKISLREHPTRASGAFFKSGHVSLNSSKCKYPRVVHTLTHMSMAPLTKTKSRSSWSSALGSRSDPFPFFPKNKTFGFMSTLNTSFLCPNAPAKIATQTPLSTFQSRQLSSLDALSKKCGAHGCAFKSLTAPPWPRMSRYTMFADPVFLSVFASSETFSTRITPVSPATASNKAPPPPLASHHAHAKNISCSLPSLNERSTVIPPSFSSRYTEAQLDPTVANTSP
mmetsp:Transcript_11880/g.44205  ORF Transcript_11880/g.44205 Transcript_11880/m.44205 type:complete len:246 (-) Transcript_11880:255-992(-)